MLDEPFAGVDPIAVSEIQSLVEGLKGRGIGVLITDHNVRETLGIVDRAYILHDGHVLKSGTVAEVVRDEAVRRVYLGSGFGGPPEVGKASGLNVVGGRRNPWP